MIIAGVALKEAIIRVSSLGFSKEIVTEKINKREETSELTERDRKGTVVNMLSVGMAYNHFFNTWAHTIRHDGIKLIKLLRWQKCNMATNPPFIYLFTLTD